MISLELWRARIGTFNGNNCKRCSGCSLLLSSSLASSSAINCRHIASQEQPSSSRSEAQVSSCYGSSLPATSHEWQPALAADRHLDHHAVGSMISCFSSSSSRSSQDAFSSHTSSSSLWSSFSSSFPCDQFFLHRSLLRDAVITLLIAIISQLLMVAGDVETNPGPKHGGENEPRVVLSEFL